MTELDKVHWCCDHFRALFAESREMGFGIVLRPSDHNELHFVLQHRALSEEREKEMTTGPYLAYVSRAGIRFCPWCGRDLAAFYAPNADRLREITGELPE